MNELDEAWMKAMKAWRDKPSPGTEAALERASDSLRRSRQSEWKRDGVTDADLRERYEDDSGEDD